MKYSSKTTVHVNIRILIILCCTLFDRKIDLRILQKQMVMIGRAAGLQGGIPGVLQIGKRKIQKTIERDIL